MVKAFEAVAVTVIEPPKLTDDPLIVIEELVRALLAMPLNVPPSVRLPLVVTVPVRVRPLTVPVPLTEVTEPEPLLLNVVQSAALRAPRLVAEAVGTFSVITGVVVLLATVELRSVPDVPNVSAATLVTVPVP